MESGFPEKTNEKELPGKAVFTQYCLTCHQSDGSGDASRFCPRLTYQHYEYLIKQIGDTRDNKRRNGHPEMHQEVKGMNEPDIRAVANFISRLQLQPKK